MSGHEERQPEGDAGFSLRKKEGMPCRSRGARLRGMARVLDINIDMRI